MRKWLTIPVIALLVLLMVACAAPAAEPSADAAPHSTTIDDTSMADETMMADDGEMADDTMMADDGEMADDTMMADDTTIADDGEMADDTTIADDGEMADDTMMADDGEMADDTMMADDGEMADDTMMADNLPIWMTMPLVNASTGETFTLADFAGQTVFVEPMATWCTNCRAQMRAVREARNQLGGDFVFVGLSVETSLPQGDLANYAAEQGFDWPFAVLTQLHLQALAAEFGQTFANPPSTPHFIIWPDGSYTSLETGMESAEEIVAQLTVR